MRKFDIKHLKNKFEKPAIYLWLQLLLTALFLLPYFLGGKQIFFGESLFNTSWLNLIQKNSGSWFNLGMGAPATFSTANCTPIIYILAGLQKIGVSMPLTQFFWYFLLTFLPFLFVYLFLWKFIKLQAWQCYLLALLYIINPVFLQGSYALNPWLLPIFYLLPLFWYTIGSCWRSNLKTFAWTILAVYFSLYIFANPPYVIVAILGMLMGVLFFSFYYDEVSKFKVLLKKSLFVLLAFFPVALPVMVSIALNYSSSLSSYSQAVDFMSVLIENSQLATLDRVLTLKYLTSENYKNLSYISKIVTFRPFIFILIIPILIALASSLAISLREAKAKKIVTLLLSMLVAVVFLLKGLNHPFKFIFLLLFKFIPLFNMFKSSPEKFSPLFIFLTILLIAYGYKYMKRRHVVLATALLSLFIFIFSSSFWRFKFIGIINHFNVGISQTQNVRRVDTVVKMLNGDPLLSSIMTLPGNVNYLMLLKTDSGYYLGLDPVANNVNKGSVEAFHGTPAVKSAYNSFLDGSTAKYLPLFNVRYLILNKNTVTDQFVFLNSKTQEFYQDEINKKGYEQIYNDGEQSIYRSPDFLPVIYLPKQVAILDPGQQSLSDLLNSNSFSMPAAFAQTTDNSAGQIADINGSNLTNKPQTQTTLEYKEISSSKYRVIVHHAPSDNTLPLIFSRNFNSGWQLFLRPYTSKNQNEQMVLNYNSSTDAASPEEAKSMFSQGLVSNIDGNKVDYISKNLYGSIQNDNLANGPVIETWVVKKINIDQFKANSFSNGWLINSRSICDNNQYCQKNADGSYDFEMVLEFKQQKYIFIAYILLSLTVASSLSYVFAAYIKKK